MKKIMLLICLYQSMSAADIVYQPLHRVLDRVKLNITSRGFHTGTCIHIQIQNMTSTTVYILIDAGYLLDSKNDLKQDILIIKPYHIALNQKNVEMDLEGYCSQSRLGCPSPGEEYMLKGYHIDTNVVNFAHFLSTHIGNNNEKQAAVWCMTDNHNVASIHKSRENLDLRKYIAKQKGEEVPWYDISYSSSNDTNHVFSDIHTQLVGDIEFEMKYPAYISLIIKDENGLIVKKMAQNVHKNQGKHSYKIDVNISPWKKGKYTLYVIEDESNINQLFPIRI